jgi:hypothetical protein
MFSSSHAALIQPTHKGCVFRQQLQEGSALWNRKLALCKLTAPAATPMLESFLLEHEVPALLFSCCSFASPIHSRPQTDQDRSVNISRNLGWSAAKSLPVPFTQPVTALQSVCRVRNPEATSANGSPAGQANPLVEIRQQKRSQPLSVRQSWDR